MNAIVMDVSTHVSSPHDTVHGDLHASKNMDNLINNLNDLSIEHYNVMQLDMVLETHNVMQVDLCVVKESTFLPSIIINHNCELIEGTAIVEEGKSLLIWIFLTHLISLLINLPMVTLPPWITLIMLLTNPIMMVNLLIEI